jgi:hypothetical protein
LSPKQESRPDKTRSRLLAAGWGLLALSLSLGIIGPRLTVSSIPVDIANSMGDVDWLRLGWMMGGMIVGALALMCFVAQWVLRPRRTGGAHQRADTRSK